MPHHPREHLAHHRHSVRTVVVLGRQHHGPVRATVGAGGDDGKHTGRTGPLRESTQLHRTVPAQARPAGHLRHLRPGAGGTVHPPHQ